jgi:hypothetical protein
MGHYNLFHRLEDFQIELRNYAYLHSPFALTALIERQPLTKFPKLRHTVNLMMKISKFKALN